MVPIYGADVAEPLLVFVGFIFIILIIEGVIRLRRRAKRKPIASFHAPLYVPPSPRQHVSATIENQPVTVTLSNEMGDKHVAHDLAVKYAEIKASEVKASGGQVTPQQFHQFYENAYSQFK